MDYLTEQNFEDLRTLATQRVRGDVPQAKSDAARERLTKDMEHDHELDGLIDISVPYIEAELAGEIN